MRLPCKLTAVAVCAALLLSLASCVNFGVGEGEDDFKQYFSGVYVLSQSGAEKYSIEDFNRDINIEDMNVPVVIPCEEYCYIGFRVANGYTVSVSEFAFFARSEAGDGVLELEFYVVDQMPTSIKGDDGEDVSLPSLDETASSTEESTEAEGTDSEGATETETETQLLEDEVFHPSNKIHVSGFSVSEEWDSVLLQFDGAKTLRSGQYIVVRIRNNCYSSQDGGEVGTPPISFTFNYLLFHFTDAHKE